MTVRVASNECLVASGDEETSLFPQATSHKPLTTREPAP
jgi:hypothetical protein